VHLRTIQGKAVQWFNEEAGPEDYSPMDTNQSGDQYHKDTVGVERLQDRGDTICSEEVRPTGYQSKGIGGTKG